MKAKWSSWSSTQEQLIIHKNDDSHDEFWDPSTIIAERRTSQLWQTFSESHTRRMPTVDTSCSEWLSSHWIHIPLLSSSNRNQRSFRRKSKCRLEKMDRMDARMYQKQAKSTKTGKSDEEFVQSQQFPNFTSKSRKTFSGLVIRMRRERAAQSCVVTESCCSGHNRQQAVSVASELRRQLRRPWCTTNWAGREKIGSAILIFELKFSMRFKSIGLGVRCSFFVSFSSTKLGAPFFPGSRLTTSHA